MEYVTDWTGEYEKVYVGEELVGVQLRATDKQVGGYHYQSMPIQPSEFIVKNGLGWYEGNAVKYICRHKQKGGKQDLEKALHYLQLAIEHYYD